MVDGTALTAAAGAADSTAPILQHETCLFCNKTFGSLEHNIAHMQKSHSFFIPDTSFLVVDLDTFLSYLHLVINGYKECICCGTQRSTKFAAQQHMLDKGHCRFDHKSSDSEFADFYDFNALQEDTRDEEDENLELKDPSDYDAQTSIQLDENSLRLPSGKVVTNRSQGPSQTQRRRTGNSSNIQPNQHQSLEGEDVANQHIQRPCSPTMPHQSAPDGLHVQRSSKRRDKVTRQLATFGANAERSLAHLSSAEQRTVLAVQQEQVDSSRRAEERYRGRLETLGNKTLMTHFVKDAADKRTMWK